MDITKQQVEEWCIDNGHVIVDINKDVLSFETVINIAYEATGINKVINAENRKHEYSFSRFLCIAYLDKHYATGIIAERFDFGHSNISYARNLDLFNCKVKYFKLWQQSAILYFRDKIKESELCLLKNAKEQEKPKVTDVENQQRKESTD